MQRGGEVKRYLCVVDFEATCCDDESFPRDEMEIIEIGAVMYDLKMQERVGSTFQTFVKPQIHTKLTPFCTQLTTITNNDLMYAPRLQQAMNEMSKWYKPYSKAMAWGAWGQFDKSQLDKDLLRSSGESTLQNMDYYNLSACFMKAQGLNRKKGLARAIRMAGLEFEGTQHRAHFDAFNTARLLPAIFPKIL